MRHVSVVASVNMPVATMHGARMHAISHTLFRVQRARQFPTGMVSSQFILTARSSCISAQAGAMAPKADKPKAPSHPPYQALIQEAISGLKDRNGSSLAAITKYVGEKHNLPGPWKKTLSLQLKRLTVAGKLVKVLTTLACTLRLRLPPSTAREALEMFYGRT